MTKQQKKKYYTTISLASSLRRLGRRAIGGRVGALGGQLMARCLSALIGPRSSMDCSSKHSAFSAFFRKNTEK
jgi:hypothetical protein